MWAYGSIILITHLFITVFYLFIHLSNETKLIFPFAAHSCHLHILCKAFTNHMEHPNQSNALYKICPSSCSHNKQIHNQDKASAHPSRLTPIHIHCDAHFHCVMFTITKCLCMWLSWEWHGCMYNARGPGEGTSAFLYANNLINGKIKLGIEDTQFHSAKPTKWYMQTG